MTNTSTGMSHWVRRLGKPAALAVTLVLAACTGQGNQSINNTFTQGMLDPFEPSLDGPVLRGLVSGEEARSVLIGQDILKVGGTAGDAAAAMYFALSVTDPVRASLGGGGVCTAYNLENKIADTIAFPAIPVAGSNVGMPGNVKGMSLLQARHGVLPWAQIVAPAERLARQDLKQYAVAGVLSAIRQKGPAGFYAGPVGEQVRDAMKRSGATVSESDLRNYSAMLLTAEATEVGSMTLYSPSAQYAGEGMKQAIVTLGGEEQFWSVAKDQRNAQVQSVLQSAGVRLGQNARTGSTSFTVVDAGGNGVACAISMNAPGGTGQTDKFTGLNFASATTADGASEWSGLSPIVAVNNNTGKFYYAGVAAGGREGTAKSLILALGSVVTDNGSLKEAFATADKSAKGSAIFCRYGLVGDTRACSAQSDGFVIAVPAR